MSTKCVVSAYYDVTHDYFPEREGSASVVITSAMYMGVEMVETLTENQTQQITETILADIKWFSEREFFYAKVKTDLEHDSNSDNPIFGRSRK